MIFEHGATEQLPAIEIHLGVQQTAGTHRLLQAVPIEHLVDGGACKTPRERNTRTIPHQQPVPPSRRWNSTCRMEEKRERGFLFPAEHQGFCSQRNKRPRGSCHSPVRKFLLWKFRHKRAVTTVQLHCKVIFALLSWPSSQQLLLPYSCKVHLSLPRLLLRSHKTSFLPRCRNESHVRLGYRLQRSPKFHAGKENDILIHATQSRKP